MVYITGDVHGSAKILLKRLKHLSSKDFLIICGDFGFIWNGGAAEDNFLKSVSKHNILFIDGVNENFNLLNSYPITDFYGGKARHICGNIYHLCRGEYYDFRGTSVFVFGGGDAGGERLSDDKGAEAAYPSAEELRYGAENFIAHAQKADYIITHEAPALIRGTLLDSRGGMLNEYFTTMMKSAKFKGWYFGCYHTDRSFASHYHAMYNRVLPLEGTENMNMRLIKKEEKIKLKAEKKGMAKK